MINNFTKEELASLNGGDIVVVDHNKFSSNDQYFIKIVHRTTKTLIMVEYKNFSGEPYEIGFRKEDGCQEGGDKWHPLKLVKFTPKIEEIINTRKAKTNLKLTLEALQTNLDKLDLTQLRGLEDNIDKVCKELKIKLF